MAKFLRNCFCCIFLGTFAVFGDSSAKNAMTNKVIVIVNGNVITKLDVENRIKVFLKLAHIQINENF